MNKINMLRIPFGTYIVAGKSLMRNIITKTSILLMTLWYKFAIPESIGLFYTVWRR